jgi:hypothetical protein
MIDACHHEIDDRLRSINDAQGVGLLDREALEEPLIDRVEELLLFRKLGDGRSRVFKSDVETIKRLEEVFAGKSANGEDHLLDLLCDDILLHEVTDAEDAFENAPSE